MRRRIIVGAVVLAVACSAGALHGATPADYAMEFQPPSATVVGSGSVDLDAVLKTYIDETQSWSLGAVLSTDAGVTASISALKQGDALWTLKGGNRVDFAVLDFYGPDLQTYLGSCPLEEGECANLVGVVAFVQGVVLDLTMAKTLPASPGGIVTAQLTVSASLNAGEENPRDAWVDFSNSVGDWPKIATVAVHGGFSFRPATQEGTVIRVEPRPPGAPSRFVPGSANGDHRLDLADGIYVLNYLFRRGPPPPCMKAADANGDCAIDTADAVSIMWYQFTDGPTPVLGIGCQSVDAEVCPALSCEIDECSI